MSKMSLEAAWVKPSRLEHIPELLSVLKKPVHLSFMSGSAALMLAVPAALLLFQNSCIPAPSRAANNTQTATLIILLSWEVASLWASSLPPSPDMESQPFIQSLRVWGVISVTQAKSSLSLASFEKYIKSMVNFVIVVVVPFIFLNTYLCCLVVSEIWLLLCNCTNLSLISWLESDIHCIGTNTMLFQNWGCYFDCIKYLKNNIWK